MYHLKVSKIKQRKKIDQNEQSKVGSIRKQAFSYLKEA